MRSLPAVKVGLAETALLGAKPKEFDLECPLLSLPAAFGTTVETVPGPVLIWERPRRSLLRNG